MGLAVESDRYDVFLSHNTEDKPAVEELARRLVKEGIKPWFDKWDLVPGETWQERIEKALELCDSCAVFIGEHGLSVWQDEEMRAAIAQRVGGSDEKIRVIPVLLPGVERPERDKLPIFLLRTTWVEFRESLDEADSFHRLVSGIRGVRPGQGVDAAEKLTEAYRRSLIESVKAIWIEGLFKESLYDGLRTRLNLSDYPDALYRDPDLPIQRRFQREQPLPETKSILDIFDGQSTGLLILGEPGAGKTTLLLELLEGLLERASRDLTQRVPVLFLLSSWTESRLPFKGWLADALSRIYGRKGKLPPALIEENGILPLLDGLDEVKEEFRQACVKEIESYWAETGQLPIVVSSRTKEYLESQWRMELEKAILVKNLDRPQVESYLNQLGDRGEPIKRALEEDNDLWTLMNTPLMLFVIVSAYTGESGARPPREGTIEERREKVFEKYVDEALLRKPLPSKLPLTERARRRKGGEDKDGHAIYSRDQTLHWLEWLAFQMKVRGQKVFYVERIEPSWLPGRQRDVVAAGVGLLSGLALAAVAGPTYGILHGARTGCITAAIIGFGGFCCGPGVEAFMRKIIKASPAEVLDYPSPSSWSMTKARLAKDSTSRGRMKFAVLFSLATGLVMGLTAVWSEGWIEGVLLGAAFAAGYFVIGWLLHGLFYLIYGGLYYKDVIPKDRPSQGLRLVARNALMFTIIYISVFSVVVGLTGASFYSVMELPNFLVRLFPALVLASGILGFFIHGGIAVFRQFVIRVLLWWNRDAPYHYVEFLDFACDRILLKQVGNGYQFIHELLRDHFAARWDTRKPEN